MNYPSFEEIFFIHKKIIDITWSIDLLWNDEEYAKSILSKRIGTTIDFVQNDEYYPTFHEKLSYIFYSLTMNHNFIDWNKRTAMTTSALFIYINTKNTEMTSNFIKEFENIVVSVASWETKKTYLTSFIETFLSDYDYLFIEEKPVDYDEFFNIILNKIRV